MADGKYGQQGITDDTSPFNATEFQIRSALANVRTSVPVKIIAVHGGGVGAPPTVDVQVIANQMDGIGDQTPHGIIYGIPATRTQGGLSAIINDPKVGDTGFMSVADRDISAIKANDGEQSNPGSFRRHSLADGVYMAGMLNPTNPDQYVFFRDDGVTIADKNGNVISMDAGGNINVTGTLRVTGDVIAGVGGGSVSLLNHLHGGVIAGGDNTDSPVPGT